VRVFLFLNGTLALNVQPGNKLCWSALATKNSGGCADADRSANNANSNANNRDVLSETHGRGGGWDVTIQPPSAGHANYTT
jgi:hypothetical protein